MTLQKLIRTKMADMTLGELRQALMQVSLKLNDYIDLYNNEYSRCAQLQNRIDRLKQTQKNTQMEFRGFVE